MVKLSLNRKPRVARTKSASERLRIYCARVSACLTVLAMLVSAANAADFHVNFTQINPQTYSFDLFNDFADGDPHTIFDFKVSLSDGGLEPDINGIATGPIPEMYW
ncbi:MAG: hypothetical protein WCL39_07510, partial [Armatimonadota bacterium]